jgi:glyoxylase-like metal-dependent hydrolase (beta-lactamase superfamily II)
MYRRDLKVGDRKVLALDDGEFVMAEGFLNAPGVQHQFAGSDGVARLPIGCFVVPGDRTTLIDAGLGPKTLAGVLRGGALLDELAARGVHPDGIDCVALSHLHPDHVGWLATAHGEPVFRNAVVCVGRGDWVSFVEEKTAYLSPKVEHVLKGLADAGRLTLMDDEQLVAPGITALPAPGHTPGHTIFAVDDHGERLLILGDAMYCPQQLTDIDLAAMHDVDKELARRTRSLIQQDLDAHGSVAIGCHFPGLDAARVLGST